MDDVEVVRYRYAPRAMETLVYGGGMATHLKRSPWKAIWMPGFVLGQYLEARRIMRHRQVDLIHAHWLLPQGMVAKWLAKTGGIHYAVTSHGGDLYGLRMPLLVRLKRRIAAASAAMSVVSAAMLEEARAQGICSPNMAVLPMGVDLVSRFHPDPSVRRSNDRLLFVGRLVAKKGLGHLLKAMPLVAESRPAVHLDIAGFGPEEGALRAQAQDLGIADRVSFLGPVAQADLPGLYRRATLFVAPFVRDVSGDQEGLPVALMEAIGCGCPVIAGQVAGIEELMGESSHEVIVNPQDAKHLAARIVEELDHPELARERAEKRRVALGHKLDWQTIADGYADWLQTMAVRTGEPS